MTDVTAAIPDAAPIMVVLFGSHFAAVQQPRLAISANRQGLPAANGNRFDGFLVAMKELDKSYVSAGQ